MSNILLTGIPEVGKAAVIEEARTLSERFRKKIHSVSIGQLVTEEVRQQWGLPGGRISGIGPLPQRLLRSYAISEAAYRLASGHADHKVVSTAMSLVVKPGLSNILYHHSAVNKLHQAAGGFDACICLIDNPPNFLEGYNGTEYPMDPSSIHKWISFEIEATRQLSPLSNNGRPVRTLVLPRKEGGMNLAKILNVEGWRSAYLGFPIRSYLDQTSENNAANERIDIFKEQIGRYVVPIIPTTMTATQGDNEFENLVVEYRDLSWYITHTADCMIAFYPTDTFSKGVNDEMRRADDMGKVTILIHPNKEEVNKAFTIQPTLHYTHEDQFWDALRTCCEPKYDNTREKHLRMFVNKDGKPLFERLYSS